MSDKILYNILVAIKGLAETGLMYLQESGNVPIEEPARGHEGDPVRKVQDASGSRAVKTFGRKEYPVNSPED